VTTSSKTSKAEHILSLEFKDSMPYIELYK